MEWQHLAHSLVFETLDSGIIIIDRQNRVVDINPTAVSLLQKEKNDLVGTPLTFDHPDWSALEAALHQESPAKIELLLDHTFYEVTIRSLENSEVNGRFITLQNVTQRKESDYLLQQAKEAAQAANQSKTHFLTNMSHEIRTPLNAVVGMAEMLRQTPLNANQSEMIDVVAQSSEELMSLINNILDFAKLEAGNLILNKHPFDLLDCIESSLESVNQAAYKKQLQLSYHIAEETPHWLVGDPVRLRQILINLLENGIKFTEEGQVELNVSHSSKEETILLQFEIKDSGIGIAADQIQHIFSPFRQVDGSMTRVFGGNGLGLVICQRLVELMGGDISLTSDIGQGTAVHFSAQFGLATEAHPPTITLRPQKATLTHKRLLIITKDSQQRRHISKEAHLAGLEVYPTASIREASYWINHSQSFDIALLDAAIWQENPAIISQLHYKETDSPLPTILLVTEDQQANLAENAATAQFSGFLSSPVTGSLMYDMLLNVLSVGDASQVKQVKQEQKTIMAERYPLDILIVEDNALNRRILKNMLSKFGYQADVAANGQIALQMAANKSYDVMLMDIQMPILDGVQTTQQILANSSQHERPYIIAVTAHALEGDREGYLASGMNDYISKPITANRLVEALYQAIHYHTPSSSVEFTTAAESESPAELSDAPIDLVQLAQLVGDGTDEFLRLMTPIFLEDTTHILQDLAAAVQQQEAQKIRHAAHTLKGSSASMALTKLTQFCRELETMAKEGPLAGAEQKLAQIQAEYDRVKETLNKIVETAV